MYALKYLVLVTVVLNFKVSSAPTQILSDILQQDEEDDGDEIEKNERTVFREIYNANKDLHNPLIVNIDVMTRSQSIHHVERRTALIDPTKYWPGGIVAYKLDFNFDSDTRNIIAESLSEIELRTCIRFNNYDSMVVKPTRYISIVSEDGCWSEIGMQVSVQKLSLSDGCRLIATVQHEIMHALGFDHEQTRIDRDAYVTINWANIDSDETGQFQKVSPTEFKTVGSYDYKSIMHYDTQAFSINGLPTMTALQPLIGQMGVSQSIQQSDIDGINSLYSCAVVNGVWGPWIEDGSCSATCGTGTQDFTRECNDPAPSNGGTDCSGSSTKIESCNDGECIVINGKWSTWKPYTDCTVSCGSGTKSRERACDDPVPSNGGLDCLGNNKETIACNEGICPVVPVINGKWSTWKPYTACTVSCGSGTKSRERACDDPVPSNGGLDCLGNNKETIACNEGICPVVPVINGKWSTWKPYTACTVSCGSGTKSRERACDDPVPSNGGLDCLGNNKETIACNEGICPIVSQQTCDFESGYCDWSIQIASSGSCQWMRQTGSAGIRHGLIRGDHTTGTGYYIYPRCSPTSRWRGGFQGHRHGHGHGHGGGRFRGSSYGRGRWSHGRGRGKRHLGYRRQLNSKAIISSISLSNKGANQKRCLTFWYYMLGWNVGTLQVYQLQAMPLFALTHSHGNMWHRKQIDLDASIQSKVMRIGWFHYDDTQHQANENYITRNPQLR